MLTVLYQLARKIKLRPLRLVELLGPYGTLREEVRIAPDRLREPQLWPHASPLREGATIWVCLVVDATMVTLFDLTAPPHLNARLFNVFFSDQLRIFHRVVLAQVLFQACRVQIYFFASGENALESFTARLFLVDLNMLFQVWGRSKLLSAEMADKGFFSWVDFHMTTQIWNLGEWLSTTRLLALKGLKLVMNSLVLTEARKLYKSLFAYWTLERSIDLVSPFVLI